MKRTLLPAALLTCLSTLMSCRSTEDARHHHSHPWSNPTDCARRWNAPGRDEWQRPDEILAALHVRPDSSIADIGAGTGYMVKHLSAAVGAGGTVVALDAARPMVEYLEAHKGELGPARVVVREITPEDPGLAPFSVDGALMLDVWHHMKDRKAYAEKVFTALRPGGRFAIVDYDVDAETGPPMSMRVDAQSVVRDLEAAGFTAELVAESMPRHYVVVGRKQSAWVDPERKSTRWNASARDDWQRPDQIVQALGARTGSSIADIGAGTGYMVKHLSAVVGETGTVFALDAARPMVEYLEQHGHEFGPARIVVRQVAHDDPGLEASSVDAALALDLWLHMKGREAYAKKVFAALRPGGRFVVVDYDVDADTGPPPSMRMDPQTVVRQLEAAGFTAEVVAESMPRHFVVVGHKR